MIATVLLATVSKIGAYTKSFSLVAAITVFSFQMLPPSPSADPIAKDGTQIGMFGLVLGLLGWIRYDLKVQRDEAAKQREIDRKELDDERMRNAVLSAKLISLIEANIAAMIESKASDAAVKEATERLIRTNIGIAQHQGDRQVNVKERNR